MSISLICHNEYILNYAVYFVEKQPFMVLKISNFLLKLGWQDLNLRMAESKSAALPLGDTPNISQNSTSLKLLNWARRDSNP